MQCLVEDGKGVISIVEIQDGFTGSSQHFLFVISNKYIGKSWAEWRARGNISICLCTALSKLNLTVVVAAVTILLKVP